MQTPGVYPKHAGQEQGKEEIPGTASGDQPQHAPSTLGSEIHTDENEETIITGMKLIFLHGLQRLLTTR
jgi:hypothetical protein